MEIDGFNPKYTRGGISSKEEEAIIGGAFIGGLSGLLAAEAAESVLEGALIVVGGTILGAGIPALVIGGYKLTKFACRLITADD